MKYRIIQIAALLIILIQLSSCYQHIRTDNRTPKHGHYRGAGRWY